MKEEIKNPWQRFIDHPIMCEDNCPGECSYAKDIKDLAIENEEFRKAIIALKFEIDELNDTAVGLGGCCGSPECKASL